jgi:hypothetical protein
MQSQPPAAEEPSRYSDFTGSSSYGGDPLSTTGGGYGTASGSGGSGGAGSGSGSAFYGAPPADQSYGPPAQQGYGVPSQPDHGYGQATGNAGGGQAYPPGNYGGAPYTPGPEYGQPEPPTQPQPQQRGGGDEWDTYRDYRS